MEPRPSDEDLVRRVRAGDAEASRELFQRHLPGLREQAGHALRGVLRQKAGVSDVVQEAYLAAFRSLAEFEERGEGSFARWLARILERKVKDEARRYLGTAKRDARIERRPDGEAGVGAAHGPGPTPSAALAVREDQHAVRLALASLPDDYRTVLLLVHSSGLTFEQIGVAQARSANAVSKLYGRALRALAEALRGAGDPRRGA